MNDSSRYSAQDCARDIDRRAEYFQKAAPSIGRAPTTTTRGTTSSASAARPTTPAPSVNCGGFAFSVIESSGDFIASFGFCGTFAIL